MGITRRNAICYAGFTPVAMALGGCEWWQGKPEDTSNLLMAPRRATPNPQFSNVEEYVDQLGRGFDSVFDDTNRFLAEGEIKRSNVNPTEHDARNTLDYLLLENQDSYYNFVSKTARAKGRYKIVEASGSASTETEEITNSYSIHVCSIARRFDKSHQYKNGTIGLTEESKAVLRNLRGNKDLSLKFFGDSFISGVIPGAELFIDIQFETATSSSKRECKASLDVNVSKIGNGSVSYSQLIREARGYKRCIIKVLGLDAETTSRQFDSGEAAFEAISRFLAAADGPSTAAFMNYRPISELSLNGQVLDWVNNRELLAREAFVARLETRLAYLDLAQADAGYVSANPSEFDPQTRERAQSDTLLIGASRERVLQVGRDAYGEFKDTGKTSRQFALTRLDGLLPSLKTYQQIEPPPPSPQAPPPPPPPPPEPREHTGIHDVLRERGG
ncbi:MAG TPA: hypothetical protein VIT38_12100 [Allosphingosinicella sp.]